MPRPGPAGPRPAGPGSIAGPLPPIAAPSRPPVDLVSALETALADAIARAEPSVVAIARDKDGKGRGDHGRPRPEPPGPRAGRPGGRSAPSGAGFEDLGRPTDCVSFDYGSGVVIGDDGRDPHGLPRRQGGRAGCCVRAAGRPGVRGRDHRRRPPERPGRDRPPRGPGRGAARAQADRRSATPRSSARGRSCSRWATRSTRRATAGPRPAGASSPTSPGGSSRRSTTREPPQAAAPQLPDPAPARRQAQPGDERRGGRQPEGRAGRPDDQRRQRRRASTPRPATPSRSTPSAGGRSRPCKQGKEVEYGFLGIGLDPRTARTGSSASSRARPAGEGGLLDGDAIIAVGGIPVADSDTLVLAVNAVHPPATPIKLRVRRDGEELEKTVVLSKFPVDGEVIATNRAAPGEGSGSTTQHRPPRPSAATTCSTRWPGAACVVTEVAARLRRRGGRAQGRPDHHQASRASRSETPADFARRRRRLGRAAGHA